MNNVNIIGTMVADVTLKYLSSGLAVGSFAIAVNQDYKKQDGTKVEKVSFFDIKVMGKQSETVNNFFSKGSRIGVTGELDQESWTAQDGSNRSKIVIKLQNFTFIDRKSENQGQTNQYPNNGNNQGYNQNPPIQNQTNIPMQQRYNPSNDIDESDIPFAPIGLQYPMMIHSI